MTSENSGQSMAMSQKVLQRVAEETEKSPTNLREPLYTAIDPDALNALYSEDQSPSQLTFTYNGYQISIDDGYVEIITSERQR